MTAGRILVLGAGGFIGAHVREALQRMDDGGSVILASRRAPTALAARERWVAFDATVADRAALAERFIDAAPDVIVNCAGITTGDEPGLIRGNVTFVIDALAARTAVAPDARLVHLGSSAEYGAVPAGIPIREDDRPNPVGAYGRAKLAATEAVLAAGHRDGLEALVLRVFNPIGPGLPDGNLLTRAARAMLDARASRAPAITLGRLDAYRDFVDVDDVAEAVAAAALHPGPLGPRVVNVGSGRATRARDLVTVLARVARFDGAVIEDEGGSPRSLDVPWQAADVTAAAALLGWRPRRDLEASVRATWAWVGGD